MILACQGINKSYGTNDILKDISFHIEDKEKAAIVGINGAGKSTLLKIIMGEESSDSGQVVLSKNVSVGYLAQNDMVNLNNTIMNEMLDAKADVINLESEILSMEKNMKNVSSDELESYMDRYQTLTHQFELKDGYTYKSEITGVLRGLGFSEADYDKQISSLSGGQKTRVALGRLLLTRPDLILLDEPTNHLDGDSVSWLEGYLSSYPGSVLIVSHDRYFLDKIVTKVISLENAKATAFLGNYSEFAKKREQIRESQLKAYFNQQAEIKHQQEVITKLKSFNREKSIKRAESREKMLDKMEVLDKPEMLNDAMRIKLEPEYVSGTDVLTVEELSKSFGDNELFTNIDFEIKRGERVALIGANGTGKTTILKILNKLLPKDSGRIRLGSQVLIGYYDQEHQMLSSEKTIFEEIQDAYPTLNNTKIRNVLAAFLFTGDDVFKRIGDLSGGERGRVSLAKLMLSSANFLILDEPTNHLDITSKEILENALNKYTGTILYVSHDRYFINQTATRIYDLVNKRLINYPGNYDFYVEQKKLPVYQEAMTKALSSNPSTTLSNGTNTSMGGDSNTSGIIKDVASATSSKEDWKLQKEQKALERKRQNELKKVEDRISELEEAIATLDEEMALPENSRDVAKLLAMTKNREEYEAELNDLYEKWESLG